MIPNIFHFLFGLEKNFGNKPFSLSHFIAIKSAYEINRPDKIYLYYRYEPSGEWWEKAKSLVELVPISVPQKIFGRKLNHFAHKADVLRLLILKEFGGVYLDIDTICIKPISPLFRYDCILAKQVINEDRLIGLCNAVIMSSPQNLFLQKWIDTYVQFRSKGHDEFWGEHSIRVPWILASKYPDLIHLESEKSFFYPSYLSQDMKLLFEERKEFPDAYLIHLWETFTYEKYLKNLTPEKIKTQDTTYNLIARNFI